MNEPAPSTPDGDPSAARPRQLLLGLLFGIAFGFLLQKGGVAQYDVLIGSLLLTDFTVFKVMLSAILVGMIGIFSMHRLGLVKLHPKPTRYAANIIGGLVFGAGFALCGYCPGTAAAAIGQASYDAPLVAIGMLIGSFLYAGASTWSGRTIERWGDRGKLLLPQALHLRPGITVAIASVILAIALVVIHRL